MNLFRLIPNSYRRRGVAVGVSVFVQALLDFVGLAALLPIIILVADRDAVYNNNILNGIREWSGLSDNRFIVAVCGAVVVVIAIKGVMNIFLWRYQNSYIMSLYRYFSERLFNTYHNRGLLFIKGRNSAKLAHEVNFVCMAYVVNVLTMLVAMMSNIMLLAMMFTALIAYNARVAGLLVLILVPVVWGYFKLIRSRLQDYGRRENDIRRNQNKLVVESLQGYPEIEVAGVFPEFEKRFDDGMQQISSMRLKVGTIAQIPSVVMDVCIALALTALVTLRADVVAFGIFAIAAVKILPSIKSVVGQWMVIRNNRYTVEVVEAGMACDTPKSEADVPRASFNEVLSLRHASFAYPDDGRLVINDLSLDIHKGETVGIRGVSGGGKTTLFNILLGFYPLVSGEILVDSHPLDKIGLRSWHGIIGYVPQNVFIMDSTIADNISMGEASPDRERILDVIRQARLSDFVDSLPDGLDTVIGESGSRVSGGQKQRIGIARALYKRAEILLFDEATSSLDSVTENEITASIEELSSTDKELTILIIAHRESSLAFCNRIIDL